MLYIAPPFVVAVLPLNTESVIESVPALLITPPLVVPLNPVKPLFVISPLEFTAPTLLIFNV